MHKRNAGAVVCVQLFDNCNRKPARIEKLESYFGVVSSFVSMQISVHFMTLLRNLEILFLCFIVPFTGDE